MSHSNRAVVSAASAVLAHVPGLVRYGSKAQRELAKDSRVAAKFFSSLRSFDQAVAYAPHQAYIGHLHPRDLPQRPWFTASADGQRFTHGGEIMPEREFIALLAAVDEFGLIGLDHEFATHSSDALQRHPLARFLSIGRVLNSITDSGGRTEPGSLPLYLSDQTPVGAIRRAHEADEALSAPVLLENLCGKATATLALLHLLSDFDIDPNSIEYVMGCGEEAIGDRYQRGGGNLGKSVAGVAGLSSASGADIKNFCAAPVPALVIAASLVSAGVFSRVVVIAGGSLAKTAMKFQGHLKNDMPILEDVVGGAAFLVQADDGHSPVVRLDAVGRHTVSAGGSNPQIMHGLAVEPLERTGLKMIDVDDFATELHNPEITEPQGSGNVPERNYRTIAALAVQRAEISREAIDEFVATRGMPGFAPTQGHLASSLCYLPHALKRLTGGDAQRVLMLAKGSLFLGRMSQLSDGMSVLLERNAQ